jgi:soluble lytic murein transglycosylase-like protein
MQTYNVRKIPGYLLVVGALLLLGWSGRGLWRENPKNKYRRYDSLIERVANQEGVSPNLIRAIVKHESDFDPKASTQFSGAKGLMQIVPSEAEHCQLTDVLDPEQNISCGTHELKRKMDRFNGDVYKALQAYVVGTTAVEMDRVPQAARKYAERVLATVHCLDTIDDEQAGDGPHKDPGARRACYDRRP